MARKRKPAPSMRRVAEGVYQRPSGRYVAPVYDPQLKKRRYDWPGVPKGGFETLEEAKAFKRRTESEKRNRGSVRETCDEFAGRWTRDFPRRQETTNLHNGERVRQFAKDFEGVAMSDVTRVKAREWALANPGRFRAVRAMFADAARDGIVGSNPFAGMKLPETRGRADILVLTEEEVRQLEQTAVRVWGEYGAEVFGPLIATAAYTGMRPGELYALKRSAISWELDELTIRRQLQSKTGKEVLPKGGKQRTITLLPRARVALQQVPAVPGTDYVFTNQDGGPFYQRTLHYYWTPVRAAFWGQLSAERQEEIDPGFDFYELRHFYGTHLATYWELTSYEIADQMGHVDGGTLASRIYIHPVSRDVRAKFRRRIQDEQSGGAATG